MTDYLRISYIGHGTVLIETAGVRVLTDPLLRAWAGPLRRHAAPPDLSRLLNADVVLLSHLHIDHVDVGSLRLLDRRTTMIGPPAAAALLRYLGFERHFSVRPGEQVSLPDVTIVATEARHTVRRYPLSRLSDAIGFVVRGSSDVYFAGDTAEFEGMAGVSGSLRVALLPISGWAPVLDQDEHLTPTTAARALRLLCPAVAVPIHWGAFAPPAIAQVMTRRGFADAEAFRLEAARLAPDVEVRVIPPGQAAVFDPMMSK